MARAIRKSFRDVVAVLVLAVLALVTSYYILQNQRLRIPILEEKPFELKAEFETAQAVVPGQGQTVRVAGVRVGDVQKVELVDGVGVITYAIDREFLPIYRDATILMRPTTGLKDMFFDMDPGTRSAGEFEEGDTVAMSNTAPDVNLDQILEALDADTQAYLRLLIVGAGRGIEGRDKELGELLGGLGPINRDFAKLNVEVAKRKANLARVVHNLRELTHAIGRQDEDVQQFISASNASLGAINEPELRDGSVRRTVRLLGPTLAQTRLAFDATSDFAAVLGPAFNDLRPFARNLDEMNASLERLATTTTPVIRDEIRPFVRAAREPLPDLRTAAARFSAATPRLKTVLQKLNTLGNLAAFNPNGAEPSGDADRDEGYLFWAGWLSRTANATFSSSDANGPWRRIYLTARCENIQAILNSSPLAPVVSGLGPVFAGAC